MLYLDPVGDIIRLTVNSFLAKLESSTKCKLLQATEGFHSSTEILLNFLKMNPKMA